MEFQKKYLKYKIKYLNLKYQLGGIKKSTCDNVKAYAVKMSETIQLDKNFKIKFKFRFLDNTNECLQEARNFLKNKTKNEVYLSTSLRNAKLPEATIHDVIIVAIGSSSTQAYYFNINEAIKIDLGIGAWYGVQNHDENKDQKLNILYSNLNNIANTQKKKYIIIHKSGSFGIKHYKEPEMVVKIDEELDPKYQYNDEEKKNETTNNAFITLNQFIEVIRRERRGKSSATRWLSVANFNCFDADWFKNIAETYFKAATTKNKLYIMDFGGGSDTLAEVTRNKDGSLNYRNLFSEKYIQQNALSYIDRDDSKPGEVLNGYVNIGQTITIKEQIIKTILDEYRDKEKETVMIHVYQTGVQREWADSVCAKVAKDHLTEPDPEKVITAE